MRKIVMYILFAVAIAVWSRGQEVQKPEEPKKETTLPKFTPEEKLAYKNAQLETHQAFEALESTEQYKALQDAQRRQNYISQTLFAKYKVDPNTTVLCDGPSGSPCETVARGDLELRAKRKAKP